MMTPDQRLVHMANQIARNLAVHGDAAAARATADHIAAFWDPRMRAKILSSDAELEPIAAAAVPLLREGQTPDAQTGATIFSGGGDAG